MINDMNTFSKKTNKEAKIKNFQQVEEVLRQLKVKFDAKLINQIMNEERGASLRLLYQMKLALTKEQTQSNTMTMTNLAGSTVQNRLQQTKMLSQNLKGGSLDNTIYKTMNKSKKLEVIEKGQLKYEYARKQLEDKAWNAQKEEEKLISKLHQDMRQKSLQVMDENREFMSEWQKEGKQNWKKNQQRKQDMLDRQKYFEDKEVQAYKNKLNQVLDEATKDMGGGIDEYEKNLQKLGIEQNTNMQDALKRMEEKKGVPPGQIQNFSYAATMNKIKEKKNISDFAGKERDRRRRKLIVDQSKTQTSLEQKKTEEQLIAKLLEKQKKDDHLAYLDWRNVRCKALVLNTRTTKANTLAEQRETSIQEMERKKKEDFQKINEERKVEYDQKKRSYVKVRREDKLKKRAINIEACSEIIDLIMDVANQAYEQQAKGNKKLNKPQWREWMSIFVQNKFVSQVLSDHQQSPSQSLMDEEIGEYGEDPLKQNNLEDVLALMKSEPAFDDFLSYLSVCGPFNFSNGQFSEWYDLPNLVDSGLYNLGFQFLDSSIPPANPDFGRNLKNLFMNLFLEDKTSINMLGNGENVVTQKELQGIPHYLPIKLSIIGRSFSGKRTSAKMINEHHFKGKLKIFRMEDMIKEVLEYVTPKTQAEVIVDKKGKAPVKGKAEEVPVDPYQGLDTTYYKEIGHLIKKFVGEGGDLNSQDILSLITDDQVLVRLFIAKLKLAYPHEKSEEVKNEELKKNILREKELLHLLNEAEAANAVQVEQKAAKKNPAPAKGGKNASNEEQLKLELEEVTKLQPEGWILLDFPRTLKQAKLMEQLMNGYTCMIDQEKSQEQEKFEQWSKLVTPSTTTSEEYSGEIEIQRSTFDGVIMLDVLGQECKRRSQGRKVDPQTGTIYHIEDNPPPENDNKLKDRLQEYVDPEADPQRINLHHSIFEEEQEQIKKWLSGFGLKDQAISHVGAQNLLIDVPITQKTKKDEVTEKIYKEIQGVIRFKQAQLDQQKKQIKEDMAEQEQAQLEEQEIQQEEQQQEQQEPDEGVPLQESKVAQAFGGFSTRDKLSSAKKGLSNQEKKDIWDLFETSYYKDSLYVFKMVRRQKDMVFEGFNDTQKRYIEFLERPDNKQSKVQDFIESFNKFSEEFPDLREDEQTKEELLNRVETLSNDLWAIIENRKDEAIGERKRIMENGWIQHEMKKLIKYGVKIIQSELNKFQTVYQLTLDKEIEQEILVESIFNNLIDQGIKPLDENSAYPLLVNLFQKVLISVDSQAAIVYQVTDEDKQKILLVEQQNLLFRLDMIKMWLQFKLQEFNTCFNNVCDILDDWIVTAVALENSQSEVTVKNLSQAIREETMHLESSLFTMETIDLFSELNPIEYSSALTPIYLQALKIPDPYSDYLVGRFKANDLEELYKQFRYYAYEEYLDSQTFIHLLVLAFKDGRVPEAWRYMSFNKLTDLIERFKVTPLGIEGSPIYQRKGAEKGEKKRDFVNWKNILSVFILLTSRVPSRDEVDGYGNRLREACNERGELNCQQFVYVEAFFDNYENRPESKKIVNEDDDVMDYNDDEPFIDQERLVKVKTLIFNVHKNNTDKLKLEEYLAFFVNMGEPDYYETIYHSLLF